MRSTTNFIVRLRDALLKILDLIRINYDETKIPVYTLPDPLRLNDGGIVTCPKEWQKNRRTEILHLFQSHVYGRSPKFSKTVKFQQTSCDPNALSGLATRKEVTLLLTGQPDGPCLHLLLYLPNHAPKPVPAFLGLNFYGNHTIHPDPCISLIKQWQQLNRSAPPVYVLPSEDTRGNKASRWPVEKILKFGYALGTAYYGDLEPDFSEGWRYGIRSVFDVQRPLKENLSPTKKNGFRAVLKGKWEGSPSWASPEDWGAIAVWAWGLSRILNYLERDSDIRETQVVLVGHSRLGKAALWAGAQDDRFAIVISNNSGCGGAALSRRRYGETVKRINRIFPHFFCKNFKNYNGKENRLPVDQHMLIALMAPRPVYLAIAEQDMDADPFGEFLSCKHANPVYALFGLSGLGVKKMPDLNEPVGKTIGYHIRTGKHDITDYDWDQFLPFADRHFGKNFT